MLLNSSDQCYTECLIQEQWRSNTFLNNGNKNYAFQVMVPKTYTAVFTIVKYSTQLQSYFGLNGEKYLYWHNKISTLDEKTISSHSGKN